MRIDLRADSAVNVNLSPHVRVVVMGMDVTNHCFMADDELNEIGFFPLDRNGRKIIEGDHVVRAFQKYLDVRIVLRPKAPKALRRLFKSAMASK